MHSAIANEKRLTLAAQKRRGVRRTLVTHVRTRFHHTLLFVLVAGCGGKLQPSSDAGPSDDLDDAGVPRPPVPPGVDGSSKPPTTFPPPGFDSGRPPPIPPPPGIDSGPPPAGCPELVPEAWFSTLQLDGTPLGRPYAAWGVSDKDFYVAIGVETNSWPNASSLAAVAHWDGAAWTVDRLPPINDISGMSGRSGRDLWILGMTQQSGPRKLLRNEGSNGWRETAISEYIVDIELVGPEEGFMSGSRTSNLIDGVLYRIRGDSWTAEPLPDIGQRYGFLKLEANGERQVYGQGYVVGRQHGLVCTRRVRRLDMEDRHAAAGMRLQSGGTGRCDFGRLYPRLERCSAVTASPLPCFVRFVFVDPARRVPGAVSRPPLARSDPSGNSRRHVQQHGLCHRTHADRAWTSHDFLPDASSL